MSMMNPANLDAFARASVAISTAEIFARTGDLGGMFTEMESVARTVDSRAMMAWLLDDFVNELRRIDGIKDAVRHIQNISDLFERQIEPLAKAEADESRKLGFSEEWGLYRWSEVSNSLILTGVYESKGSAEHMLDAKVRDFERYAVTMLGHSVLDNTIRYKANNEVCITTEENTYIVSRGEPTHFNADKLREKGLI